MILLGSTFLVLELGLQVFSVFSLPLRRLVAAPWDVRSPVVVDERLGIRGNPLRLDADPAGYRNPSRPLEADIVALGDSQTWGPEDFRQSWPHQVGSFAKLTVYNMALPGYGPLHSLLQLNEALAFKPNLIVVAPYFGNDFYETFLLFQRHPEFIKAAPQELVEQAARIELLRPIQSDVDVLFNLGEARDVDGHEAGFARRWIANNIKLYGLLRALRYQLQPQVVTPLLSRKLETAAAALDSERRRYASVLDGPDWRTILTAPYRNRVIDVRDPRIRLGFDLSREAVRQIAGRCRSVGIDLLVVLIPTKESVFFPRVGRPEAHPELEELVMNEARSRDEWIADLEDQGIGYVDALMPLRAASAQPYPEDVDGHPTGSGHKLIALEVTQHIARRAAPDRR